MDKEKYVIFGAGDFGRQALALLDKGKTAFFVDNDAAKVGTEIDGVHYLPTIADLR